MHRDGAAAVALLAATVASGGEEGSCGTGFELDMVKW